MSYNDVVRKSVEEAIRKFDQRGKDAMLKKYGRGASTRWYVCYRGRLYDQKLLLRAAHELQGLGRLPSGPGTFKAGQARQHLKSLGFDVVG